MEKLLIAGAATVLLIVGVTWFMNQSVGYAWPGGMMWNNAHREGPMREATSMPMGMGAGQMSVQSERTFIERMVPHHEEAIATAQEVLDRGGTTPGMVALAENIISSQTVEVELMKESYEEWYETPYVDTGEYVPMMRELADYSGVTLDKVFLHDMTMHHMGAIMMARSVQPYIEHEVMQTLTDNIIVNQTNEIQTMQQLYGEL